MKRLTVSVALITKADRWFLQRRPMDAMVFPGLWELPGGKVEQGETEQDALLRELQEELRWSPGILEPLPELVHGYPEFEVALHPFRCAMDSTFLTRLSWGWFRREEALRLPLPEATRLLLGDATFYQLGSLG